MSLLQHRGAFLHSIFKGERGFIKDPHCQKQKTARTVASVAPYLSGVIHKVESDSVTLYYVTWSNVKPLIFHHRTERIREMEGVCNASTALDCSDSTRTILWAVILYICTLDFIAKWRLLSWNSFGSLQIYHLLSQTQTAAWKWGACTDALYFVGRACRRCYFSPLRKKKKNEELWPDAHSLRGWKFNLEMAHISKPTIIGILCSVFLTTYISRFSVMAGNRAYMTQLDILLIKPLNP